VDWPSNTAKQQPPAFSVPLATDAEGFLVLFDGKNTAGWMQVGTGSFKVADGIARSSGGPGVWYFFARSFNDFVLRLEFRRQKLGSDSGIFVRIPRAEGDAAAVVRDSYEIQIAGPTATGQSGAAGDRAGTGQQCARGCAVGRRIPRRLIDRTTANVRPDSDGPSRLRAWLHSTQRQCGG
jgi:hypothetical protein